ncbi:MAG: hypothetical protein ACRDHZ_22605, partial [Ktedonobacteraceae bacterium]
VPELGKDLAILSQKRRLRQLRQTADLAFAEQGITHIEQSIGASFKTVIYLLTNFFQCVTVHRGKHPLSVCFCFKERYLFWQFLASQGCLFPQFI